MIMRLYDWELLTLGHHVVSYGGSKHCDWGDKSFSICHVISKDHVFKGLSDFTGGSPL